MSRHHPTRSRRVPARPRRRRPFMLMCKKHAALDRAARDLEHVAAMAGLLATIERGLP